MHANMNEAEDLRAASGLREAVETIFRFESDVTRRARVAMTYQFDPERSRIVWNGLSFDVVLNAGRHKYIQDTLNPATTLATAEVRGKRTLLPHGPPPGSQTCPLDGLRENPLLVKDLYLD